jgi:hypothetical protein
MIENALTKWASKKKKEELIQIILDLHKENQELKNWMNKRDEE